MEPAKFSMAILGMYILLQFQVKMMMKNVASWNDLAIYTYFCNSSYTGYVSGPSQGLNIRGGLVVLWWHKCPLGWDRVNFSAKNWGGPPCLRQPWILMPSAHKKLKNNKDIKLYYLSQVKYEFQTKVWISRLITFVCK